MIKTTRYETQLGPRVGEKVRFTMKDNSKWIKLGIIPLSNNYYGTIEEVGIKHPTFGASCHVRVTRKEDWDTSQGHANIPNSFMEVMR